MRNPNATAPAISNKLDPIPMPNASATSNFCELQFQRPPISAKTNASATTAIQTRARTLNQCNCDNSNPNQSKNLEPMQLLPPLSATSNLRPAYTAYSTLDLVPCLATGSAFRTGGGGVVTKGGGAGVAFWWLCGCGYWAHNLKRFLQGS